MTPAPRPQGDDRERAYNAGLARLLETRSPVLARPHAIAAEQYLPVEARAANLARCRGWNPEECAQLVERRDAQRSES